MRYSTIIAALLTTAMAVQPAKRQLSAIDAAIVQWGIDIDIVNDYLNGGATSIMTAFNAALDEPNQLAILGSVNGLSEEAMQAVDRLMANFKAVPNNLGNIMNMVDNPNAAITAITYDRCCTVLPSILTLFQAAAATEGEALTTNVDLPIQCSQFQCLTFSQG